MNILDIAKAIAPEAKYKVIGIRPGEKLHEQMIGVEDAPYTFEYDDFQNITSYSRLSKDKPNQKWKKLQMIFV